jgi:hypothetical protein
MRQHRNIFRILIAISVLCFTFFFTSLVSDALTPDWVLIKASNPQNMNAFIDILSNIDRFNGNYRWYELIVGFIAFFKALDID